MSMTAPSPPPTPSPLGASPRWSVFSVGDNLEGPRRRGCRPSELLEYVEEAERLGYWEFFFAEHHFHPHGEVPDPWLMVTAAAERTRGGRIRLGPMVSNLAFRHPVQVAEQALLANALSDDRIEVGVGSGNIPQEHVAFGLHPEPVARKREAFDRALPVFLTILTGGELKVPMLPAGGVRVEIGPPVAPMSRVWFATGNTEAAVRFTSQGHSVALGPPFATMKDLSDLTKIIEGIRAEARAGRNPAIAAAFPTYAGPEPERALDALDEFLVVKSHDGGAHRPTETVAGARPASARDLVRKDLALVGTPEAVARQLHRVASTGITDLFAIPDFGGLPPDQVVPSLRALAEVARLRR